MSERTELNFSIGVTPFTVRQIPEELADLAPWGEIRGTNESTQGILERAQLVAEEASPIGHFAGVGRPEKVIAQMALLHPATVTHVEISDRNMVDSILMFNALMQGIDIQTFFESVRERFIDMEHRLFDFSLQELTPNNPPILQRMQRNLEDMLQSLGLTIHDAMRAVQDTSSVQLLRANIKDPAILSGLIEKGEGEINVIDFSNIPVRGIKDFPHTENVVVFSAINAPEGVLREKGILEAGKVTIGPNTVWHYGQEDSLIRLPVVYSPTVEAYYRIVGMVDSINPKW